MNHPTPEQWLDYLYSEHREPGATELEAHLQSCDSCRALVTRWRSTGRALDLFDVAVAKRVEPRRETRWKWAAVAIGVLFFGVMLGRLTVSSDELRAEIVAELNDDLGSQLNTLVQEIRETRLEDREATLSLLEQFEMRRLASESLMRRELETVAINTQTRLQQSERRLRVFDESVNNLVPVNFQPPN